MGNIMRYCYPLTIMDSRYVLAVVGMHRPTFVGAKTVFEALFQSMDYRSRSTSTMGNRSQVQ